MCWDCRPARVSLLQVSAQLDNQCPVCHEHTLTMASAHRTSDSYALLTCPCDASYDTLHRSIAAQLLTANKAWQQITFYQHPDGDQRGHYRLDPGKRMWWEKAQDGQPRPNRCLLYTSPSPRD